MSITEGTEGFYIDCTTCAKRLKVKDPSAIGQIFGCPKCGSMVLVEAPEGWEDPAESPDRETSAGETPITPDAGTPEVTEGLPQADWASKSTSAQWLGAAVVSIAGIVVMGFVGVYAWKQSRVPEGNSVASSEQTQSQTSSPLVDDPDESENGVDVGDDIDAVEENSAPQSESSEHSHNLVDLEPDIDQQEVVLVAGQPITDNVQVDEVFAEAPASPADTASSVSSSEATASVDTSPSNDAAAGSSLLSDSSLTPSLGAGSSANPSNTLENLALLLSNSNSTGGTSEMIVAEVESTDDETLEPPDVVEDDSAEVQPRPNATLSSVEDVPKLPSHARPVLTTQKLEQKLLAVRFDKVPLLDFLRSMMELTGVPFQIDPVGVKRTSAKLSTPVSVAAVDKSSLEIVKTALQPLKLAPVIDGGVVRITTPQTQSTKNIQHSFRVGDLNRASELDLATVVESFIEPDSWEGGRKAELRGEKLAVTHSRNALIDTLTLLEKLRVVRGLEPRKKLAPHRVATTSRWSQANRYLSRPISVSVWHARRWPALIAELEEASGLRILVDWMALGEVGVTPNTETSLRVRDRPAARIFSEFFDAFDLVIVPLGGKTVQLTSRSTMLKTPYVEFYSVAKLTQEASGLLDALVRDGAAVIDAKSNFAIVLVDSETHRRLSE